jgi:DNA polymerase-3 subunit alpha
MISYHTAYLKANYRSEFMAAYLSSQMKAKKDVLGKSVREIRRSGVNVLPPDINSSMENFTAVGEVIRFGLGAVAKVGHNTVGAIVDARRRGKFTSLWDFISRVDMEAVTKSAVESLIKAGAFDEISPNRAQLTAALPDFFQVIQKKSKNNGQYTLFELLRPDEEMEEPEEPDMPQVEEDKDPFKRLEQEKAVMGIYISGHPFDQYEKMASKYATCTIEELSFWTGSIPAKVGGIILSVTDKVTKSGNSMGLMNFEDSDSNIEMVCFPRDWEALKAQVQVGRPYIAEGRMGDREPRNFIVQKLTLLEEGSFSNNPEFVRIRLRADLVAEKMDFKNFAVALKECPGKSPVLLELMDERDSCVLALQGISVGKPHTVQLRLAEVVSPETFEVA